jgi:hypothetical protein
VWSNKCVNRIKTNRMGSHSLQEQVLEPEPAWEHELDAPDGHEQRGGHLEQT